MKLSTFMVTGCAKPDCGVIVSNEAGMLVVDFCDRYDTTYWELDLSRWMVGDTVCELQNLNAFGQK